MTEFKFTIDQIKGIFFSGVERGHDEATAFEWGSSLSGSRFSGCIDAIHDIINDGKTYNDADYVTYDTIGKWFAI